MSCYDIDKIFIELRFEKEKSQNTEKYDMKKYLQIKRNSSTGFVSDVECKVEMGWGEDTPRKVVNAGSYYLHEVVTCKFF